MRLAVVGMGCGSAELITDRARRAILDSDVFFVTEQYRHIAASHPDIRVMKNLHASLGEIEAAIATKNVAVGVSGDPGAYSMLGMIRRHFADRHDVELFAVPGIGSLSYFFAALCDDWTNVRILSGHGRALCENALLGAIARNEKTVVFCGPERSPNWVCDVVGRHVRDFCDDDPNQFWIAVGENLSLDDEKISRGSAAELLSNDREFHHHALVAIFNESPETFADSGAVRPRDEDFIRGNVPITRQEVRSVILDELRLDEYSVVWDVGAGTGSVSVACARLCHAGEVHAVEQNPEAIELITQNRKKFRAFNLHIHHGSAPEILQGLPRPTHVFVGGSGGRLGEILNHIRELGEEIKVCVSAVTVETTAEASNIMTDGRKFKNLDVVSLAVTRSRALGGVSLMAAQNPVTLWTAVTTGDTGEKNDE